MDRNRANHKTIPKVSLEGLAKLWDTCEPIRRRLSSEKRLLVWKNAESVGVASFKQAVANISVLDPFFELWASKNTTCRTPSVSTCWKEVI